ncbi:MAG: hypothetical protein JRI89_17630 [Deltaproteobacteria bacterium]|nr:hypothetical protein [Deltaproteobacteria bacterium]
MKDNKANYIIVFIVVFILILVTQGESTAITIGNMSDISKQEQTSETNFQKTILFLKLEGDKIYTTAGVFIITSSVELINETAISDLHAGFSGTPPSVNLFYEKNKLIRIIVR